MLTLSRQLELSGELSLHHAELILHYKILKSHIFADILIL